MDLLDADDAELQTTIEQSLLDVRCVDAACVSVYTQAEYA